MATIEIRDLSKNYGTLEVMSSINLPIEDGEFCVLVGPSGCGKSTLLRMIAGLEEVTSGAIFIDGEDVTNQRPGERDLAMVFQSYALYPHKTVRDNLGFSLRMHRVEKHEAATRIETVAKTLGLELLLDRHPAQLSGGQRQRVAMGRAMVRNPSVFLFDEPLSNLDAKLRVQMRTEIRALHQRINATTVYVTHDQIEAMTMADRIIVMNGGKIEQSGPPLELFDNPANVFVAGFLGSPAINFLHGNVKRNVSGLAVELGDGTVLSVPELTDAMENTRITLGIRPHQLSRTNDGPIKLQVKVVEPTGVETLVFGSSADTPIVCQFAGRDLPKPDEILNLTPVPGSTLLFDGETGDRL